MAVVIEAFLVLEETLFFRIHRRLRALLIGLGSEQSLR